MIKLPSDTPGDHLMLRLQVLIGMANGIIMGYNGIKFDQMTTFDIQSTMKVFNIFYANLINRYINMNLIYHFHDIDIYEHLENLNV